MKIKGKFAGILLSCMLFALPVSAANMNVGINQSQVLNASGVYKVAVANPEIADVVVLSSHQVMLVGKKAGSTTLHIWRNAGQFTYTVLVSGNDVGAAQMIQELLGYPDVHVSVAGGKVILEGMVENQYQRTRAEKLAGSYGEVVNLLEMSRPKQVRIESRIIEISTDKVKNLGIAYGNAASNDSSSSSSDNSSVSLGTEGSFGFGQSHKNTIDTGRPFNWFGSYANINAQLNLLIKNGDAKILSQPYVITMSGEKADILIGGEIPVPVNTDDNTVTVEWREYGIRLEIEPNVQQDDGVDTKIQTEVSSLDWSSAVNATSSTGVRIPGLLSRKANSHVLMQPGMTMAIGGLISSTESKSVSKIPLLGDIPILGQFFRNTSKTRERKEILILLTPILVDSDYQPVMSEEASRLSKMKDSEVLRGDVYAEQKK